MRFLFLDVDGCLNDHKWNDLAGSTTLDRRCVNELNRILHTVPRVGVVLSSAWRYMIANKALTLLGFKYLLQTHGVTKDINLVGITPPDERIPTRGMQIRHWLDNYEGRSMFECESFVVLDDAPDGMCFCPVEHRLVKTDGKVGLTAADADRVIAMLLEDMR